MYDAEERRSSVSDEEMKDYVRKYFLYQVDGWEEEVEERKAKKKVNSTLLNPEFMPIDVIPAAATSFTEKAAKKLKSVPAKKK
jgi:2-isopropylmalate synthase